MKTVLGICVLLSVFVSYSSAVNCTGRADGVYEAGCRSFAKCVSGVRQQVNCKPGMVYNNATGTCDDSTKVGPPCGSTGVKDCTGVKTGLYADTDRQCTSYYECNNDLFLDHQFCPGGTVFNEILQSCDWKANVPPPCGTKGP